jgi:branched-chain amino acid transport system permease protein
VSLATGTASRTAGKAGAQRPVTPPPPAGQGSSLRRLTDQPDLRRLVACLFTMLVLAMMTGPDGSITAPTSGITTSLAAPRIFGFLGAGVALWGLITLRQRFTPQAQRANDFIGRLPSRLLPNRAARLGVYLLLLAAAIVLPLVPPTNTSLWQEILVDQIGIFVLMALGLNVVVGFAGLLDLGYIAFYAIGAYSACFWTGRLPIHPPFDLNPFWALPLAIIAAMLAGVILGIPTLRLRGDYLAIVTLGFGEIIGVAANNAYGVTNGAIGVLNVPHFSIHIFGLNYTWGGNQLPYYYLVLAFVVITVVAFFSLENSRVGRAWTAIREDEVAAQASGINPLKYKVMAFAIGASTSGFAGMLTASKISYVNPGDFTVQLSILVLVLVIFGGMGSIIGAIVGAAFLQWFPQFVRVHPSAIPGFQVTDLYVWYGALLIVMMIFRPQGLIPSRRRRREIGLAEHGIGSADAMEVGPSPEGFMPSIDEVAPGSLGPGVE